MLMKRYFSLVLVLCLLTGCAPTADEVVDTTATPPSIVVDTATDEGARVIPFTLPFYPDYTLDPNLVDHRANLTLTPLLYEGLFALNQNFVAQPLLCANYTTSGDGLIWTFTLREGVTFSDGTPLTGDLVAASLKNSAADDSRYAARLANVTRFEGDETTMTLTLATPNTGLPALLDVPLTLPQEETPLSPLGTGLYYYDEASTSLLPRTDYWQDEVTPSEVIPLQVIRHADDLVATFDAGYVSLVDVDLMGTQAPYFSTSYEVWDYPTSSMVYLGFNMRTDPYTGKGLSPCANLQLRHIVSMSVERGSIVGQDFAQHAVAATLPVHPASPLYDVLLAATGDYSPAMLTAALEEMPKLDTPLRLVTANENGAKYATAQRIIASLNQAGIATELVSLPWEDYLLALEEGNFDIYLAETQLTADFDLTHLLQTGGALNFGGYTSPSADELLLTVRSAPQSVQSKTASNLYSHLLEQAPIVPICFKNSSVLTQWGQISQLTPTQANPFYHMEEWIFTENSTAP